MSKQRKPKSTNYILLQVPVELKLHFKAFCAKRGLTMKKAFTDFMKDCVTEDMK